jgi:sec-independent protein translocase protein TatB
VSGGFFGIGPSEFIVLGLLALIILGPDKLPRYAAEAARFLRDVRAMVAKARRDVKEQLGPEFQDISLSDLDPRAFVTRNLLDGDDDPLGLRDDAPANGHGPRVRRLEPGQQPPYDVEAT